ncbi:MAG: hypothetical protein D6677_04695 [Calditrichaeota bacterium]|nr:MAG: hypothetical protein D6677_04695 [Calditrichota bacterium]
MKWLLIITACFSLAGAQDSLSVTARDSSVTESGLRHLQPEAFRKFYIGVAYENARPALVTLDIQSVSVADSAISFSYILNRHNTRMTGVGYIWPHKSRIYIDGLKDGRVDLPRDGKLIFESLRRDSTYYWKLKEN